MSNKKELTKLQKEWYKKLKDEGFEDLETFDKNGNPYLSLKDKAKYKVDLTVINSYNGNNTQKDDYYTAARSFLWDYFEETYKCIDRAIWLLHSDGVSIDNILKSLAINENLDTDDVAKLTRHKVHKIIKKYRDLMIK